MKTSKIAEVLIEKRIMFVSFVKLKNDE